MKTTYNNIKTLGCVLIGGALAMQSCTGKFDEWNVNPNEVTAEEMTQDNLNTGAYYTQMQKGVFIVGEGRGGEYQITQALEGDVFASYFAPITSWQYAPTNNDHYNLYQGWYNAPFKNAYTEIMQPWKQIKDATSDTAPDYAMATIIKVLAMQRITDMYGPIPYTKFGTGVHVAYDSQQEVYNEMFKELESAIDVLTSSLSHGMTTVLADYDNVYQGNIQKWVKMANSLRLRMAMRISYVDEATARAQAEAAINHSVGMMQSNTDDAILHQSTNLSFKHPLWEISTSWDDEHMSATMEVYLNGLNDPRVAAYFQPAVNTGLYKGARNGMKNITKANFQNVTSRINKVENSDMEWMHAAETYFLLAEAKLRWGLGSMSVKDCYEEGIRTSFASAGVSGADAYISNDSNLPLTSFVNPSNNRSTNISSMTTNVTVAWNEAATEQDKMKKIMLQKWIALYPDGQEAWSEIRRTGYPGIVTPETNSSNGEVKNGEIISRLKFPSTEYADNSENTQAAVQLLGGADNAGTRLWWNVNR